MMTHILNFLKARFFRRAIWMVCAVPMVWGGIGGYAQANPTTKNAPAQKSAAPSPASVNQEESQAIYLLLIDWARKWSAKDVEGYLALYSKNFKPRNGRKQEEWQTERRRNINNKKTIDINISKIKLRVLNYPSYSRAVSLSFVQDYQADRTKSRDRKTLIIVLEDGQWRIIEENIP